MDTACLVISSVKKKDKIKTIRTTYKKKTFIGLQIPLNHSTEIPNYFRE